MTKQRITELATKAFFGQLSKEEQNELERYSQVASPEERKALEKLFDRRVISSDLNSTYEADSGYEKVHKRLFPSNTGSRRIFMFSGNRSIITIAASICLFIAGAFLWQAVFRSHKATQQGNKYVASDKIVPVGNRATLTLADGKTILLDSATSGALAIQGGTQIFKDEKGNITYNPSTDNQAVGYNTVVTPRGGQFRVTLPDATKVWLNNSSSIRFPTTFTGAERKVEITGEVYFEVTKDKAHPFIAVVDNATVTVLGTHFNIKAYAEDGPVRTTLVEGSVKVSANNKSVILIPGQQALQNGSTISVNNNVDTDLVTAWIGGNLAFTGADIETVMRVIQRYYDVDVIYEGKGRSNYKIDGMIPSNSDISAVVKMLTLAGYHIRIQGKTIYVLP